MSGIRQAIPEDFQSDPTYERRFRLAVHLLVAMMNREDPTPRHNDFTATHDLSKVKAKVLDMAKREGLIVYDDLHHAPMCWANHFCGQRVPSVCTCGART